MATSGELRRALQQGTVHHMTDTPTPISQRTILVHKKDAEGALIINALTGHIQQPLDERPEWSEGLTLALLSERHGYYTKRLGSGYTGSMQSPETIAYEDLGWIGVDAEGEPVELDADAEHRMGVIAEVLGITRTDNLSDTGALGTFVAEVEIAMDRERTPQEVAAFEHAQQEGFKTGTNGA